MWVKLNDSVWLCRTNGRDTVPASYIHQVYVFRMLSDSDETGETEYSVGEFTRNGERIPLWWVDGRKVTTETNILSYNSHTEVIRLAAGDTLRFYRELYWWSPRHRTQTLNGYHSYDTLAYAVELVRIHSGERMAMLDSIGIMPCPTQCVPVVHGSRPIKAEVAYVVPERFDGDSAFLRVRLYNKGDGDFFFDRTDVVRIGMSASLGLAQIQEYLAAWGPALQKRPGELLDDPSAHLDVRVRNSTEAEIRFSTVPDGSPVSLAIYSASGSPLYSPYTTPHAAEGEQMVIHNFQESGFYVIGLLHNGRLVKTRKLTILCSP